MRAAVLSYHDRSKMEPNAHAYYTEDEPPKLTLFDDLDVEPDSQGTNYYTIRTYVEPLFSVQHIVLLTKQKPTAYSSLTTNILRYLWQRRLRRQLKVLCLVLCALKPISMVLPKTIHLYGVLSGKEAQNLGTNGLTFLLVSVILTALIKAFAISIFCSDCKMAE